MELTMIFIVIFVTSSVLVCSFVCYVTSVIKTFLNIDINHPPIYPVWGSVPKGLFQWRSVHFSWSSYQ